MCMCLLMPSDVISMAPYVFVKVCKDEHFKKALFPVHKLPKLIYEYVCKSIDIYEHLCYNMSIEKVMKQGIKGGFNHGKNFRLCTSIHKGTTY